MIRLGLRRRHQVLQVRSSALPFAEVDIDAQTYAPDEILITAPVSAQSRSARIIAPVQGIGAGAASKLLLLHPAIPHKGAQNQGVGRPGGEEKLN